MKIIVSNRMKKIILLIAALGTSGLSAYAGQIKSRDLDQNYAASYDQDKVEALQKEVQALSAKYEELTHTVHQLQQQLANASVEQAPAMATSEAQTTDNVVAAERHEKQAEIEETPKLSSVSKGPEKQQYDIALAALKGNDLTTASEKFQAFIHDNPKSQLLSNALFWYGEVLFKQKSYDKAALNFLKSYKQAPKGAKASDSLLRLATSLAQLNKVTDACGMLNKLENEFPKRPASSVQKAESLRTKIKCKQ